MALTNTLQQVQTYQRANLAYLQNLNCFIGNITNKKFKDFQKIQANLGSTVTFDLPPRFTTQNTLIANFQPTVQRVQPLTVDQSVNTSYAFTAQERIFNVDKDTESYMKVFGKSATHQMGATIESSVALNCISGMPVNDSAGNPTGALHTESGPFRFYGDGITAINSYQQLAQMIANFKNFGAVDDGIKVVLSDLAIPGIVGSGLNQFAPRRNDEIAMSWEVGEFGTPPVDYFISNLLPVQVAGTVGNSAQVLTLVSTNDPTGNNITQLTFSGATPNDADAVKSGDLFQFQDGVSGKPNMRYLTFIGQKLSGQPVQFRATADAGASSGGNVTVNIYPPLQSTPGATQNLNNALQAGMQVKALPTHRAGVVVGGDAFYLAMPALPKQPPFDTANEYDDETGVSMRLTYGSTFGQNQLGLVHDAIWGATLVPEYSMRVVFPV
jgi:hypothetical protein